MDTHLWNSFMSSTFFKKKKRKKSTHSCAWKCIYTNSLMLNLYMDFTHLYSLILPINSIAFIKNMYWGNHNYFFCVHRKSFILETLHILCTILKHFSKMKSNLIKDLFLNWMEHILLYTTYTKGLETCSINLRAVNKCNNYTNVIENFTH